MSTLFLVVPTSISDSVISLLNSLSIHMMITDVESVKSETEMVPIPEAELSAMKQEKKYYVCRKETNNPKIYF